MINLYAGIIENDTVENFIPITLATPTSTSTPKYTNGDDIITTRVDGLGTPISETLYRGVTLSLTSGLDSTPTDLLKTLYDAVGINRSDNLELLKLINKKLNFFTSESIESKLNFEMIVQYAKSLSNNEVTFLLFLGDIKRAIGFSFSINASMSSLYLITNPLYNGNSLDELLESSRTIEESNFRNKIYEHWNNFPQYALFYPYTCQYDTTTFTLYGIGNNAYGFAKLSKEINSMTPNLNRWANWYTMITNSYYYGEPFKIKLATEVNGLSEIELSVPVSLSDITKGNSGECVAGDSKSKYISLNYYNVGTDLNYLFPHDNTDTTSIPLIGADLVKSFTEYRYDFYIINEEKGINFFYDANDYGQFNNDIQRRLDIRTVLVNGGNYVDTSTYASIGAYLLVPSKFTELKANKWLRKIPKNYSKYEYNNCPIAPFTFDTGKETKYDNQTIVYPDYFNQDNFNAVEVPNFLSDYIRAYSSSSTSHIFALSAINYEYPIDYSFWNSFLSGFPKPQPNIGGGSIGGGYSNEGGGNGNFDDVGDDITNNDIPTHGVEDVRNLFSIYSITSQNLSDIGTWLNSAELADYSFTEKTAGIISLKKFYTPSGIIKYATSGSNIKIIGKDTGVKGKIITSQYIDYDMGSIDIKEYFGNFLDYSQYTRISIYLPFCGIKELKTDEVMNSNLKIKCSVDCLTGDITYNLIITKNNISAILYTFTGNSSYDIPIFATDYKNRIGAVAGTIASGIGYGVAIAAAPATLGGSLAIAGAATAVAGSVANAAATFNNPDISRIGDISSNAGMMSYKTPYLIITRPKMSLPENYSAVNGFMCNLSMQLSELEGYSVIDKVHLENITGATDTELNEIESLLKEGVIF